MAKITDASTLDGIWIGSKWNEKRSILNIPAGGAEEAGVLFLESVNSAGVLQGGLYVWADSSNALRYGSTLPTDEDSDGSVLDTASTSNASKTLDNLSATTLVNASIVSDTDGTDDLGSSSIYWKAGYFDKIYLSATATITGGSNVSTFDGGITIGSNGSGHDLILYGETAGQYVQWDMDYSTNAGGLLLKDNVILDVGTGHDVSFSSDGTNLSIVTATDDTIVKSGATHDLDWQWESYAIAGQDMGWIADIGTFQLCDDTILNIGGASVLTAGDGFAFVFIPGSTPSTLNLDPTNANDLFRVGETTVADVQFDGASYNIIWNGSDNAYIFQDSAELAFGTALDIYMRWENSGSTLDIGQTSDGTGSIDIIDTPVLMTGADSAGALLTIAGIDTTGNSDTVTIAHSGTGSGLHVTCTEADSQGIEVDAAANQTTWAALINGAGTPAWIGANDIGMLTLKTDTAGANAGATGLLVQHATAQPITAAEGHLARFISTGTAQTNAYGVEIGVSTTQGALHVSAGHSLFAEKTTHKGIFNTVTNGKATVAGATTGLIAAGLSFWSGDSDNDAHIVVLPAAVEGQQLVVFNDDAAQEFKLTAASGDTINGGTAAGAVTVTEDEVVFLFAVNATDWRAFKIAGAGTLATAGQSA